VGYQPSAVRIRGPTFDEQMDVVRHEAVRQDCEVLLQGGARNLHTNEGYVRSHNEVPMALMRAEGQEVTVTTAIVETAQESWSACVHAAIAANGGAAS
jgi:hypothetical protein